MIKDTAIIIPARLGSSRLPNKPLADIGGRPMILWVLEQAKNSQVGDVYVATADKEICKVVEEAGYNSMLTDKNHASGTDRIIEACRKLPTKYEHICNLQGDLPFVSPQVLKEVVEFHKNHNFDISTPVVPIKDEADKENPNVVKAVVTYKGQALYFSRAQCPYSGQLYKHVGIYVYTNKALNKYAACKPSPLEKAESLEQLRALENGLTMGAVIVNDYPISVDTTQDLEKARNYAQTH